MNTSHLPAFVPLPEGTIIKPPQTLNDIIARMLVGTEDVRQRVMAAVPDREAQDRKITEVLEGILHTLGSLQSFGISPDDMPEGLWDVKCDLNNVLKAHRRDAALFLAERDTTRP